MQYQTNQTCCAPNPYQNGFCYTGCGQTMPIVPGSNPALNYWNGQNFIVSDGSAQNPIILPFIKIAAGAPNYVLGTDNNGSWSYYNPQAANYLSGGSAGKIPWQSAPNVTAFTDVGTSGQILQSGGTGSPTWLNQGTSNQLLKSNGTGVSPSWISTNNLSVTATGSTTQRTLANRFADVVNVKDFGALGDGTTDDTAAIQAALNSGATEVFIPPSINGYKVQTLVMPTTAGFVLTGSGTAGFLKMAGGSVITWPSGSIAYVQGSVNNIAIDGTNGTDWCIVTSYVGGMDFNDIYIKNLPSGYGGIFVNGNPENSVYSHDIALNRIRIYDNGSGAVSGIACGAYAADVEIIEPIMNLNFITNYCIWLKSGCGSVQVLGGHPYNAKVNVVRIETSLKDMRFDGTCFDNSLDNLVSCFSTAGLVFNGCRFQAVNSSKSALSLLNCSNTTINACEFDGSSGAISMVVETGSSNYTIVSYPNVPTYSNFSTPFNLIGAQSFVRGAYQNNLLGYFIPIIFCGQSNITSGSTVYLGPNGQQTNINNNQIVVPINSEINSCFIACTNAPGAGQSFAVTLAYQGTTIATGTISGASSFGVTLNIPDNTNVAVGNSLTIQVVSSSSAASSILRGYLTLAA
jgi:hypothetical protein